MNYKTVEANGTTLILDEDMAINLYLAMASQFGWQGTFFTHEDIRAKIQHRRLCFDLEALDGEELEKVVEKVTSTSDWRKWLTDHLIEEGNEMVNTMVYEMVNTMVYEQVEWEDN